MDIIVERSSRLVRILRITQSNACSQILFKAGAQGMYATICHIDVPLTICFRCNAPSKNMDCGRFIQRSEAYTELLCKSCEMAELWDDYGIVGDVKVIFIYILTVYEIYINAMCSHLLPISPVPIFMIYYHQIFSINSSKAPLKITSLLG